MKRIIAKIKREALSFYLAYVQQMIKKQAAVVVCPFCGWSGEHFMTYGVGQRPNAMCPKCGSMERHRLYYLYLKNKVSGLAGFKVLHFAPEKIIADIFKKYPGVDYLSVDINPFKAMKKEDITSLSFADDSFDLIFCSHVLEHIPDDAQAMRELHRVLKPGGTAILQVPIKETFNGRDISQTYEDWSITEPGEREIAFGQNDHVRVYGRDFKDRLEKAGFKVEIVKFAEEMGSDNIRKYSLLPQEKDFSETEGWIYHCSK